MRKDEKMLNEMIAKLANIVSKEQLAIIKNALLSVLNNYDVKEKENEIVPYTGNINERIIQIFKACKSVECKSENTLHKYEFDLWKLFDAVGKDYNQITTNDIRSFMINYQFSGKKKLTNTTMDNMRKTYSSFFNWCRREGYITDCPMDRIATIQRDTIKESVYTSEEMESLIYHADHIRDKTILYFMQSTGCRVSEVSNMNVSDIDWERKLIQVRHGKGNKDRVIPLDGRISFMLKQYIKWRNDNGVVCDALFISKRKLCGRIGKNGIELMLKSVARKAMVDNAHPHRYRSSYITSLLSKGMKIEEVQVIAGHEDINTTSGYNRSDISDIVNKYQKIA